MSDLLADIFGVDPSSEETMLAVRQLDSDSDFLNQMILERYKTYDDPADFAEKIGVSLERLEEFETDPLDFDLMFIRQYAHALDLFINHEVVPASVLHEQPQPHVNNRLVTDLLATYRSAWKTRAPRDPRDLYIEKAS